VVAKGLAHRASCRLAVAEVSLQILAVHVQIVDAVRPAVGQPQPVARSFPMQRHEVRTQRRECVDKATGVARPQLGVDSAQKNWPIGTPSNRVSLKAAKCIPYSAARFYRVRNTGLAVGSGASRPGRALCTLRIACISPPSLGFACHVLGEETQVCCCVKVRNAWYCQSGIVKGDADAVERKCGHQALQITIDEDVIFNVQHGPQL